MNLTNTEKKYLKNKIPLTIKFGVLGELIGRIGMGIGGLFFIIYINYQFDSLYYFPFYLFSFLFMTILAGVIVGLANNKVRKLLVLLTFTSGVFMIIFSSFLLEYVEGILLLEGIVGFILGTNNPTFSAIIANRTSNSTQTKSYALYKGANIIGQTSAGIIAGLIVIIIFQDIINSVSLKTIIWISYSCIGFQGLIFPLLKPTEKPKERLQTKKVEITSSNSTTYQNSNFKWIVLLVIILVAFGTGTSYAFIPLFINMTYLLSLSNIGIIFSVIGFIAGIATLQGEKIFKIISKSRFLGFANLLFGVTVFSFIFFPPVSLLFLMILSRDIAFSVGSPIVKIFLMNSVDSSKRNLWSSIELLSGLIAELLGSVIAVNILTSHSFLVLFSISGFVFILAGITVIIGLKEKKFNFKTLESVQIG